VWSVVLLAAGFLRAADDAAVRVKLVSAPLPSPEATLSPADVRGDRAYTREGAVYPSGHIHCPVAPPAGVRDRAFTIPVGARDAKPDNVITIGATPCEVVREAASFSLVVGKFDAIAIPSEKLGENRLRLGTVKFDLPGAGKYGLAFTASVPASQESGCCIIYRCGLMREGELDGLEAALYDGDINGVFEREKDGVRVGPAAGRIRVFAPCTGLISTGPKVYRCAEVAKDGSEAAFKPYEGKTGRIAVRFAEGGLEMQLVLGSKAAECYAVVGPGSGEFAVVPGEYTILYGLAYDAKKNDVVAVVAQGLSSAVVVKEGERAALSCGGPYRYVFAPKVENGELKVDGASVKVLGAAGEDYGPDDTDHPPAVSLRIGERDVALGQMRYG
jgi:hypothetical protein